MKYRLAKITDIDSLAKLHFESGRKQGGGFIPKLGLPFLKVYYKVHLEDKDSVILLAEDENGDLCGFISGTFEAESLLSLMRKNRFRFFFALLPVIFRFPSIFPQIKERYYFIIQRSKSEQFGITKGPRMDYWVWDQHCKSGNSIFLLKAWLDLMFTKDILSLRGEVDQENRNIMDIYLRLGAKVFRELKLKDGRKRFFIEFVNNRDFIGFRIRNLMLADLAQVVDIHIQIFEGFFLTFLGRNFLSHLYRNFLKDIFSICLVAEAEGKIQGFVVGNIKPVNLFSKMIRRQGFILFFFALKAFFRNPLKVGKKLWFALRYRGEAPSGYSSPALISSIGVLPSGKNKGVGSSLIMAFCWEAFLKGSDLVYLTTDKYNNDPVNSFYLKNGFNVLDELKHPDGRIMNRYIKLPDEKIV